MKNTDTFHPKKSLLRVDAFCCNMHIIFTWKSVPHNAWWICSEWFRVTKKKKPQAQNQLLLPRLLNFMWSPGAEKSFTSKKQNTCHQLLQLDGMFTLAVKSVFEEKKHRTANKKKESSLFTVRKWQLNFTEDLVLLSSDGTKKIFFFTASRVVPRET